MIMSDDEFKSKMLKHAEESSKFQAKVSTALFGDEDSQIDGLALRVKNVEKYVEDDKKFKAKVAGGLFISIPIVGAIWEYIKHKFTS